MSFLLEVEIQLRLCQSRHEAVHVCCMSILACMWMHVLLCTCLNGCESTCNWVPMFLVGVCMFSWLCVFSAGMDAWRRELA